MQAKQIVKGIALIILLFWGINCNSQDLLNGLVSVWEFDEIIGDSALDAHGSNDGIIVGPTINQ